MNSDTPSPPEGEGGGEGGRTGVLAPNGVTENDEILSRQSEY
jgi:hypothetical protein